VFSLHAVVIVAAQTCAYTAGMFASLVAALACAAPAPGAPALADAYAMSLPPDAAMAAPAASDLTAGVRALAAGDRVLASFADDLESRSFLGADDERPLFTPAEVDCLRTHSAAPAVDWSALASHADADNSVSRQLGASRSGSIAALTRARTRGGSRRVDGGRIGAAAPVFVPDSHAPPPLRPERLALVYALDGAPACMPTAATPPAPPERRIDRPPRS
jgi:hypothetical protein